MSRKRGLSLGLLAQESHLDAVFMAAPDVRSAVRTGAADLERWRPSWPPRSAPSGEEPVYADLQHRFDTLGGYTLDLRVDEALSGLGFAGASAPSRRPRCPAASRRGPPSPGS